MTERKYRKPVNANGWMRKLQVFAFGKSVPHFVGYCPFFWFTWLCLLLMPVILPVKLVLFLFLGVAIGAKAGIALLPEVTDKPKRPSNEKLLRFYRLVLEYSFEEIRELYPDHFTSVWAWIDVTPDWENCAKRLMVQDEARKLKAAKRAKAVQALSKYGAPFAKAILIVVGVSAAGFALYWFQRLIIKIQWFLVWRSLVEAAPYIGWILLAAAGFFVVVYAAVFLIMLVAERIRRCPKYPEKVTVWMKIGGGLIAGLEFIAETIESIYTRECPLIEWGDHDEPIQPR